MNGRRVPGRGRLPASGARKLLPRRAWRKVQRSLGMTPRELAVVQSLFDNSSEPAIARELGVTVHTVHTHFGRLYAKLGVRSHVQLVLRILAEYLALSAD